MRLSDAERFFLVNELPHQLKPFKNHQARQLCDSPIVKTWHCCSTSSNSYCFVVVSMDGKLLLTGDAGDVLLKGFTGWGHDWICGIRVEQELDLFVEKIATGPVALSRPELILPWLGWQVAAAATFRRLRRAG